MREILVSTPKKYAHSQFVTWLNSLLNNYETGFWDLPVTSLLNVSFLRRSNIFFQELYSENGDSYEGFLVVIRTDGLDQYLMLFDKTGSPSYYAYTGTETLFDVDQDGILKRFWANVSVNLESDGLTDAFIAIYYEEWYGTKVPMIYVKELSGSILFKGMVDALYEGRTSGTYTCEFWPEDEVATFLVENLTNAILKLEVPLTDTYLQKYTLAAKGAILVPKTFQSEYYFQQLKKLGTIKYRIYG